MVRRGALGLVPVLAMVGAAWLVLRAPDPAQTWAFFTGGIPSMAAAEAAMTMLAWLVVSMAACLALVVIGQGLHRSRATQADVGRVGTPRRGIDASGCCRGPSCGPRQVGLLRIGVGERPRGNPTCSLIAIHLARSSCSWTMTRTRRPSRGCSLTSAWNLATSSRAYHRYAVSHSSRRAAPSRSWTHGGDSQIPKGAQIIFVLDDQDGIPEWLRGLDGHSYVGVASPTRLCLRV